MLSHPFSILVIQRLICVEMRELIFQPAHQVQLKENHPSGSVKITTREIIIHIRGLSALMYNNVVSACSFHTLLVVLLETTRNERTLTYLKGIFESSLLPFFFSSYHRVDTYIYRADFQLLLKQVCNSRVFLILYQTQISVIENRRELLLKSDSIIPGLS